MKQDLSKDLFVFLLILLLLLAGYCAYRIDKRFRKVGEVAGGVDVGLSSELSEVVGLLENDLVERYALEYSSKIDPLDLQRVITFVPPEIAKKEEDRQREEERKRREALNRIQGFSLSATIVASATRSAVIRYKDKNHIVREGSEIDGRKILRIERERVILQQPNGQELVLLSRSAAQKQKNLRGEER